MEKKMEHLDILLMIVEHPCPFCGNKIRQHTDYNPMYNNPMLPDGNMCTKSHKELVIQKLVAWLNDAYNERDAYKKSYEDLVEEIRYSGIERDLND